jgi:hypothetical protein
MPLYEARARFHTVCLIYAQQSILATSEDNRDSMSLNSTLLKKSDGEARAND